jgi:hypothetical protein
MFDRRKLSLLAAATAVLFAVGLHPATAGTRRHDVDDSEYTSLAAQEDYEAVGSLSAPDTFASGVLVGRSYVLTAAHVGEDVGTMVFTLPSGGYVRAWKVIHPNWTGDVGDGGDLALIRLSTLVLDEQPAALYTGGSELGQTGVVVGFGKTGTGLTGATEPSGTKRAGENIWDLTGASFGWSDSILLADFDNPLDLGDSWFGWRRPITLEYQAASGDSGGAMFLSDGDVQKLAGIMSFITYRDEAADSDYGDAMGVGRISSHMSWLTDNLLVPYTMDWIGASGGFNVAANWQTTFSSLPVNAVPAEVDAVRFLTAGAYTVTWPAADLTNTRVSISAGDVTFDLSGGVYTLTDPSPTQPSLVVGDVSGVGQALTMLNGTLSTQDAFLGAAVGSNAIMTVGSGGTWNAAGSVYVGGTDAGPGGTATLAVVSDAQVYVADELTVWSGGTLELDDGIVDVPLLTLAGGTLSGTGTVVGDVTVLGGVISPGSSPTGMVADDGLPSIGGYDVDLQTSSEPQPPPAGLLTVPEPASFSALCAGVIALLAWRRARRSAAAGSRRRAC